MSHKPLLPVVDSITVENYQLYSTRKNGGTLHHEFVDGVNLIVGVNGLGKTTLLRLIHRLLSGPTDLRTPEELGQAQRETKPIRAVHRLFADRVTNGAQDAYATLTFRVGSSTVNLRRRIDTLRIDRFQVDGKPVPGPRQDTEDVYQTWITQACGLSSFFDFLLCLRYLTFFFENRNSIVWDADAQDELTRLFLYPTEDAQAYRVAFNEAQRADSLARNYQNILTRELETLARAQAASEARSNGAQDREVLARLQTTLESATTRRDELETTHRQLTHQALTLEASLLALEDEIAAERETALAALFPSLQDFGALLIDRMHAESACIVCGSTEELHVQSAIDRWARRRECPCCATALPSPPMGAKGSYSSHTLDRLHARRGEVRASIESARAQLAVNRKDLTRQSASVVEIAAELEPVQIRVKAAELQAGDQVDATKIDALRKGMAEAQRNRTRHLGQLRRISEKYEKVTYRTIRRIATEFDEIIQKLLAEECVLSASIDELKIGEGASNLRVLAPRFVPMMTSATSPDAVVARRTEDAVSESQRDLIDFAFRLAFLRVVMPKSAAAVFVDTPESSLDSVFIPRFAKLLASEGSRRADAPRKFVVTANLTGSPMIAKLLAGRRSSTLSGAQKKHVLNLLDNAATSAALRKHMTDYTANFNKALRGT